MAKKNKAEAIALDAVDWFQAMDRAFIAQDNIESILSDLKVIECTPGLKKKVEKAVELLADVYLYTAAKYFNTTNPGVHDKSIKPKQSGKSKRIRK